LAVATPVSIAITIARGVAAAARAAVSGAAIARADLTPAVSGPVTLDAGRTKCTSWRRRNRRLTLTRRVGQFNMRRRVVAEFIRHLKTFPTAASSARRPPTWPLDTNRAVPESGARYSPRARTLVRISKPVAGVTPQRLQPTEALSLNGAYARFAHTRA
jgi:hypothetical protein